VPARVKKPTTAATAKKLKSIGGAGRPPSFFPDAVAETEPEPADAVPVDVEPAFCDPSPERPGPVPAPLVMYYGEDLKVSAQVSEIGG
jgi:hypothetical protein